MLLHCLIATVAPHPFYVRGLDAELCIRCVQLENLARPDRVPTPGATPPCTCVAQILYTRHRSLWHTPQITTWWLTGPCDSRADSSVYAHCTDIAHDSLKIHSPCMALRHLNFAPFYGFLAVPMLVDAFSKSSARCKVS